MPFTFWPKLSIPRLCPSSLLVRCALCCWCWALPYEGAFAQDVALPAREWLRIAAAGGAGYANQRAALDKGTYAAGAVALTALPYAGLTLTLRAEMLSAYDRKVPTRLPRADGEGELVLEVREQLPRLRPQLGYEVLQHLLADPQRAMLCPYLLGDYAWFVNDTVPNRAFSLGGGVNAELRLHEGLRLLAELAYARTSWTTTSALEHQLLLGSLRSTFRLGVGAAFAIGENARLELRYQGDMLYYAHSTRVLDTLLFGPVFHVR